MGEAAVQAEIGVEFQAARPARRFFKRWQDSVVRRDSGYSEPRAVPRIRRARPAERDLEDRAIQPLDPDSKCFGGQCRQTDWSKVKHLVFVPLVILSPALCLLASTVTEADGTTPLHWASYRDDLASADRLIRAGAKVNAANDLGVTPLWPASENGSSAMVRRLLDAGANPNAALLAGETPLMVAARSGYPDVVEQLLNKGANPNAHGSRGQTALMWAVAQKHPGVVKVLIAHHADIRLKSDVWTDVMAVPPHSYLPYNKAIPHGGETALMFAARVGDIDSAKLLVAAGGNVNDVDAWGVSATVLATHSGFRVYAESLLIKGAYPNSAPNGFTALHEAVMRRDEEMVAALLDHGADANTPLKSWTPTRRSSDDWNFEPIIVGATPYWLAARFTEPGVMRMLVKHGADAKFVFHSDYVAERGFGASPTKETATALMAATGIMRVKPWV